MTILKTDRLSLNEARLRDSAFIHKLLNSSNWIQYIGDRGIKSTEDAERYIRNSLIKSYKQHGFGLYKMVLKESDKPIGLCGLLKRSHLDHPDVGFAILPEYEGKGYTYEAAKATIEYAHTELSLPTVLAITSEDNLRSQALIKKIGLKYLKKVKLNASKNELLLFTS